MFKCIGLVVTLVFLQVSSVFAADDSCSWAAKITSMKGLVEIQKNTTLDWITADLNETLCAGDSLRTDKHSRATVQIQDETFMELKERTTIRFSANQENEQGIFTELINLFKGEAYLRSRRPRGFIMETPFVNVMHEGTEFLVKVDEESTQVVVFDGVVVASNTLGEVRLTEGQSALTLKGQAPAIGPRIELRDAVQWTLYYPPVIDYTTAGRKLSYSRLKPALDRFQDNDLTGAFEQLDKVNEAERNADYHIFYASLSLMVGQVEQAQQHLNRVTQDSKKNAKVLSLQSIIALAKNDQQQALKLAEQAQQVNPQAAAPNIALSYAYQSLFDIDKALKSATQAAQTDPDNGLAWARVSEMELATGNVDASMEAASKAQTLNPRLAKTNTVLGFARLASLDLNDAEQSFRTAIQRDPSDPLARLGLGLAKIRQGHIKSGTKEMETAANLDPDNALIRSYLGKAYYEQKRGDIASTEYAIAKKLDPKDPTPWFYDAIYKQTVNRPVEALHDMQKAIELNDNRAVYRSKLLLDEDLAARSAALGRIYNDLGFQQRGLFEGWKSVNTNPSNYSAHRLLADNYAALPRHEIARVSELLQSQLLQPVNITPVQPQLAESNLLVLNGLGPQTTSFNEFNPLFTRNRFAIQASGIFGSNDTWGDEVTHSGIWNQFSYSLGQHHYESNGFRENNNLKRDIYNGFFQLNLSPKLNMQAELRYSDTESGDLPLRFDPQNFSKSLERQKITKSARLGSRYRLSSTSNLLISFIRNDIKETLSDFDGSFKQNIDSTGYTTEVQYILEQDNFDLLFGGGYVNINSDVNSSTFGENETSNDSQDHIDVYLYLKYKFFRDLEATLGVSYNKTEKLLPFGVSLKRSQFNPKFGIIWTPFNALTIRGGAFRTLNRPIISNSTIELTNIAGFNQFFDDLDATSTWQYGLAADYRFSQTILSGITFTKRNLEVPFSSDALDTEATLKYSNWGEESWRGYLYWTPLSMISFSLEHSYENLKRSEQNSGNEFFIAVNTHRTSLSFNFFDPSGFFVKLKGTRIDQNGQFIEPTFRTINNGSEDFWMADASIGYRLPKRFGILSLNVNNVFNESFNFQDTDPVNPTVSPDRTIFGQINLSF